MCQMNTKKWKDSGLQRNKRQDFYKKTKRRAELVVFAFEYSNK